MRLWISRVLFVIPLLVAAGAVWLSVAVHQDEAVLDWLGQYWAIGDEEMLHEQLMGLAAGLGGLVLLGYLVSLDPRARRRPWITMSLGAAAAGGLAAFSGVAFLNQELVAASWPALAGGGVGAAVVLLAIEFFLRWFWRTVLRKLDQKNLGGVALIVSRLALLWHPGQEALLLSVSIERFRRGVRGPVAEHLKQAYWDGNREPELLELLCQLANEEKQPGVYLRVLKDLFDQFPDDTELQDAYLAELLEQGLRTEALEHMEKFGVADTEVAIEQFADLLVEAGRLDDAVSAAARLGELEGIPMRRADAILRRILARQEDHLNAVNLLADWAERMARKDQLIRWLDKSVTLEPRQRDRALKLAKLLEEAGLTHRLEELLQTLIADRPGDPELALQLARVLYSNGKLEEAEEVLQQVRERGVKSAAVCQLLATVLFERGQLDKARELVTEGLGDSPPQAVEVQLRALARKVERALLSHELAELIEQASEHPEDLDLQVTTFERLVAQGHIDRAVGFADRALDNHPNARKRLVGMVEESVAGMKEGGYALISYLADLQVADGRYDDALETIKLMAERSMNRTAAIREGAQKILRRSPHHLRTLRTIGDMYMEMGQFTEMIHAYSLYLANGGEESEVIDRALANAYMSLNDYASARRFVNSLLESGTEETLEGDLALLRRVIPMAVESSNPLDAAEYQKQLERLAPADKETKRLHAIVNDAMGQQRFAFLRREIDAGKADGNTLEEMGDLCLNSEDFNQAITYYQRAARQATSNRVPRVKLAYCFTRKRMFDLAGETLAELKMSLDDDPAELEALMHWIYRTAAALEEAHMFERATRLFKQLMKIDAGYKDVLLRVERLGKK